MNHLWIFVLVFCLFSDGKSVRAVVVVTVVVVFFNLNEYMMEWKWMDGWMDGKTKDVDGMDLVIGLVFILFRLIGADRVSELSWLRLEGVDA